MRSLSLSQVSNILHHATLLPNAQIPGYCVDSRNLKRGELFFALKGERIDGHDYLFEAEQKGAAAAVVSCKYMGAEPSRLPLIRVSNPLHSLQKIARHVLAAGHSRIVAITGSLGKTTTKEFVNTLLKEKYITATSPGNNNSQVGLPLSILNHTNGNEEILIFEMGMSQPGHLSGLIEIAPPEVSVLTSVALVHACNFNSIEDIAWAKSEIFGCNATRLGIICHDIPIYEDILSVGSCRKQSFSRLSQNADYSIDLENQNLLKANLESKSIFLDGFNIPGKHNLLNLLAAVAVARYFHVTWEEIRQRLPLLQLPDKRLQLVARNGILFINDSYNAAEPSVIAALENMPKPMGQGRRIAVLGGMAELGKFSNDCHRRVGEHALNHVEEMYCLGEECQPIYESWKIFGRKVELFHDFSDLLDCLKKALKPSDVVLIKGSNAKQMWKIIEEI